MRYNLLKIHHQAGGFIIEVLVAMVIFSVGIVGLINMQSYANKTAAEASYRGEATMLVNDYINKMWAADRSNSTAFISNFTAGGVAYQDWTWRGSAPDANTSSSNPTKGSVFYLLPNAKDKAPEVTILELAPQSPQCIINPTSCPRSYHVTVQVFWLAPSDKRENNNTISFNTFKTTAHIGG